MTKLLGIAAVALLVAGSVAHAQGTRDAPQGAPTSNVNKGVSNTGTTDPMGSAMRGTGVPTYGTSPGMGGDTRTNSNRR
ncbi:MAG: hypothetical protein HZA66_03325 [Rhodopseudomonas palustris]|uniref:Uncharacterized protein n=1 Tax=Rhodopseudomonas palustris TaxID=1076 RepID=A0A933W019_RHOPL|nr:hypothetical protein [Rhodopseudomonas palustris]